MRIIFVRHGHPDYVNDCLTPLGHLHAEAAAERLKNETIDRAFSSSCGRARETAEHIAARHGLTVEPCAFIRELGWGGKNGEELPHKGHPWFTASDMVTRGESIASPNWATEKPFSENRVVEFVERVAAGGDEWLASLGYEREGYYYRVKAANAQTVLMASHAGSSSAMLSHIFNLSFPFLCKAMEPTYTAITIVSFAGEEGALISPAFEIMNDARHIEGITAPNVINN